MSSSPIRVTADIVIVKNGEINELHQNANLACSEVFDIPEPDLLRYSNSNINFVVSDIANNNNSSTTPHRIASPLLSLPLPSMSPLQSRSPSPSPTLKNVTSISPPVHQDIITTEVAPATKSKSHSAEAYDSPVKSPFPVPVNVPVSAAPGKSISNTSVPSPSPTLSPAIAPPKLSISRSPATTSHTAAPAPTTSHTAAPAPAPAAPAPAAHTAAATTSHTAGQPPAPPQLFIPQVIPHEVSSILQNHILQNIQSPSNHNIHHNHVKKDSHQILHSHKSKSVSSVRQYRLSKKPIIDEEEYKDTRIDYDDDDEDIKKTKASLFNFVKDIAFNLIFTMPTLRTRLKPILNNPSLAIIEIEQGIRDKLNYILDSSFKKIMEDGKIDIGDAPQFIHLVFLVINSFNKINDGEVYKFSVTREHVMLLLHYILKCVFCLTLDGPEEQMAVSLLDTSFKLVKIEVCPLISKRWYHNFRKCWFWKRKPELEEEL
jgi:hypothetical protein